MSLHHTRHLASVLIATAMLVGASIAVGAHHGWSGYSDKEFEISGTVSAPVTMEGAHATMKIVVGAQAWNLTLAPPARTKNAGLTEEAIPVGATITVHGHRHTNAKNFEIKTERITYNGKTFDLYPDRS